MSNERLKELEVLHEELLIKINSARNDFEKLPLWRSLTLNLKEQTEILKTQVENLKRQIR